MSKQTTPHEQKTMTAFVTSVDEAQGIVTAIVNTFGVIDDGGDVVHPGAFTKTIAERSGRVRVLDGHNTDSIMRALGKPISIREVGRGELPQEVLAQYPEATGGLETTTQYLLNTPEGDGAFKRLVAGAVTEYSIGYDALDVDYSKMRDPRTGKEIVVRNLRSIRLWEYSPVLWGMNPATATTGAKATEGETEEKEENMSEPVSAVEPATTKSSDQTLGAYLAADLYGAITGNTAWLLRCGRIGVDEVLAIHAAIEPTIQTFINALPAEIAEAEMERDSYGYMSAGEASEGKAGRRISRSNRDRLMGMYNAIRSMLEEDGWSLTEETDSADEDTGDMSKALVESAEPVETGAGSSSASPTQEAVEETVVIPSFDEL